MKKLSGLAFSGLAIRYREWAEMYYYRALVGAEFILPTSRLNLSTPQR